MASSREEIVNMALDYLKDAPIGSLEVATGRADFFNRNFDPLRDSLVQSTKPNFARTRWSLKGDNDYEVPFGYRYAYTLPGEYLSMEPLRVNGDRDGQRIPYELESYRVLTNAPGPVPARGLRRVINAAELDPMFVQLLSLSLALKASHFITGKASLRQELQVAYNQASSSYNTFNLRENPYAQPVPAHHEIIDVRRQGAVYAR